MISYPDLYELVRKEKYSETLQLLPKNFLQEAAEYLQEQRKQESLGGDIFTDAVVKSKKQLENFIVLFKELILRRKKKLLTLVFVAAETGIMKRDYETMLSFEREMFEHLVKTFEEGDKELGRLLHGKQEVIAEKYKMVLFRDDVDQFIDSLGNITGPFTAGALANVDAEVADILVAGGKAQFVDE